MCFEHSKRDMNLYDTFNQWYIKKPFSAYTRPIVPIFMMKKTVIYSWTAERLVGSFGGERGVKIGVTVENSHFPTKPYTWSRNVARQKLYIFWKSIIFVKSIFLQNLKIYEEIEKKPVIQILHFLFFLFVYFLLKQIKHILPI